MVVVFIQANSGKDDENRARQAKTVQSAPMENSVPRFDLPLQKEYPEQFRLLEIHRNPDDHGAYQLTAHYQKPNLVAEPLTAEPRTCEQYDGQSRGTDRRREGSDPSGCRVTAGCTRP